MTGLVCEDDEGANSSSVRRYPEVVGEGASSSRLARMRRGTRRLDPRAPRTPTRTRTPASPETTARNSLATSRGIPTRRCHPRARRPRCGLGSPGVPGEGGDHGCAGRFDHQVERVANKAHRVDDIGVADEQHVDVVFPHQREVDRSDRSAQPVADRVRRVPGDTLTPLQRVVGVACALGFGSDDARCRRCGRGLRWRCRRSARRRRRGS